MRGRGGKAVLLALALLTIACDRVTKQVAEAALLMAALGPNATLEEVSLLPAGGIL